jgi:hypothetical protein
VPTLRNNDEGYDASFSVTLSDSSQRSPRRWAATLKASFSAGVYPWAIPLAFVNMWYSRALYVLVATPWLVPDRRIQETPRILGTTPWATFEYVADFIPLEAVFDQPASGGAARSSVYGIRVNYGGLKIDLLRRSRVKPFTGISGGVIRYSVPSSASSSLEIMRAA